MNRALALLRLACTLTGFVLVFAGAGIATAEESDELVMNAEIDHLLDTVAASGCTFIRNGKEHDAAAARDHLQMKRKRGRRYFDSADEFVERLASRSSFSKKDYMIRCGDEQHTANAWFTAALSAYRSGESAPAG